MCGGFTCSKNALIALNVLYIVVAFVLIGVAVYGRAATLVTNLPIVGGILACGIILMLISVLGLLGAVKHHQVMLFFYMVILFLLFLIQFSVACACLGVNLEQQTQLAEEGWKREKNITRSNVQNVFSCCGFDQKVDKEVVPPDYTAIENRLCVDPITTCHCPNCMEKLQNTINYAFKLCGWIGLFFSFTEFMGVLLTVRYRNQKDPRANPSAFL
ncbi:tetraspanin-31-A isoform X2 [Diorhabda carinulata]|uniref:tetraspanin-31-A isoform X2 n=1 Tax=Diorhabda sublineata TaxID=1163346 RepID=UPI0024E06271|nr:tetraspanin-31-A isoform X2 [Diorhabda sublineata]XP_056640959.1 tetraspanin-31-A isoform X2 [Diorhabda sublineata]XP_057657889.1 tetraspanin-31-A isoform X2 [Diorhabda carinulata]